MSEEEANKSLEAFVIAKRIIELHLEPIRGKFDLEHLKSIHHHIFQDFPIHKPGKIRSNVAGWVKNRELESISTSYTVPYLNRNIGKTIEEALDSFDGKKSLLGVNPEQASIALTKLYGDLDYAHGFYEGNSRTLREFTRTLALDTGMTSIGSGMALHH